MYRLGRRPALDGLRTIAVAVVFLSHVHEHMPGGYYGVDGFFVLSGFLITSILLTEEHNTGAIALKAFYSRRARRLLPALACMLAMVVAIFIAAHYHGSIWPSILAVVLYVSNWAEAFGPYLGDGLLTHTWSLAIEEQFYIVWPLVLAYGLHRRWNSRTFVLVAVIPAVGSFMLRSLLWRPGVPGGPTSAFDYFSMPTRADGILSASDCRSA
jgi:peptidoglycan/LPS O-acetylase OafA/YrhL